MISKSIRFALAASTILVGLSGIAQATVTIDALVGGAPTGVNYVNFDNLSLGNSGGTSGGVTVSFGGGATGGEVVNGTSGTSAAPYLSNGNGTLFGDPSNGADTTNYLTTGIGSVTLGLPGQEEYVGLLWGSVDLYNTLSLYNGSTLVATITGSAIEAAANGNQGINGTYYVNIDSTTAFNSIVASSTSNAFELDNVAYNPTVPVTGTPEPISLGLLGLGVLGIGFVRKRKAAPLSDGTV